MCRKIVSIVIISALVVTMGAISVFAANEYALSSTYQASFSRTILDSDGTTRLGVFRVYTDSLEPYKIEDATWQNTTVTPVIYMTQQSIHQQFHIIVQIVNTSPYFMKLPSQDIRFALYDNNWNDQNSAYLQNSGWEFINRDFDNVHLITNNTPNIYVFYYDLRCDDGNYYLPPYTTHSIEFDIERIYTYVGHQTQIVNNTIDMHLNSISWSSPSGTGDVITGKSVTDPGSSYQPYLQRKISDNVQSILDQWSVNSELASNVSEGTATNNETLAGIDTVEGNLFSNNDEALALVGLEDFSFNNYQMAGINSIGQQYNLLWDSLQQYQFVYVFAMMLGLVTLLIRHAPRKRASSGGGKNGGSSS